MKTMRELCAEHVSGELVSGVERDSFDKEQTFFKHAHMVMPDRVSANGRGGKLLSTRTSRSCLAFGLKTRRLFSKRRPTLIEEGN